MDFIKKNYEKILLSVVLLGLAGAVAYLLIKIPKEKEELAQIRDRLLTPKPKPLDPVDMTRLNTAYKRLDTPARLNYSGDHNLLNPVQWQKLPNGQLKKNLAGSDPAAAVQVVKPNPLFTTIAYEGPGA